MQTLSTNIKVNTSPAEEAAFAAKGGTTTVVPMVPRSVSLKQQAAALKKQIADAMEEEAANKPPSARGRGVMEGIKRIVLTNPKLMGKDLVKACQDATVINPATGKKTPESVIVTARSDTLATMRVAKEMGLLTADAAKRF